MKTIAITIDEETLARLDRLRQSGQSPGNRSKIIRAAVDDYLSRLERPAEGLPKESAARCDFLMLMFKRKLTRFVSTLPTPKRQDLRRALMTALQLES